MFEGKKPTAEKPLGIQDFLQAECFPAEPEKTSLSPHENCFNNEFAFFVQKKIPKKQLSKILHCFSCQEAPIFQNKRDTCLSGFQLLYLVEKTILSNIGEHACSLSFT